MYLYTTPHHHHSHCKSQVKQVVFRIKYFFFHFISIHSFKFTLLLLLLYGSFVRNLSFRQYDIMAKGFEEKKGLHFFSWGIWIAKGGIIF